MFVYICVVLVFLSVFFYNFGWPDLSIPDNFYKVLDMCKVLQYAISQGKVAIHCHAGKGSGMLCAGCDVCLLRCDLSIVL